ncbi:transposase [Pedobacter sp. Du54]|uniref:IS110 family transposase n=1 Tax=Pedobacter anseongensis TaxID=3133439 RepID=UPI0030A13C14
MKSKKYSFYIGIDVSKVSLDFVLLKGTKQLLHNKIGNTNIEITQLIDKYKNLEGFHIPNAIFGMENTGVYCNPLIETLTKIKANFVVENAYHIKNSLGGIRGKTDEIDAGRIALYIYKSRDILNFWKGKRDIIEQLRNLTTLRTRLVSLNLALSNPLKENVGFIKTGLIKESNRLCSRSMIALKIDIADIEASIRATWLSDERLKRIMEQIISVPCVGEVTALQILITTNEFKNISNPKKFACYSGVAPFPQESGTSMKKPAKTSHLANKQMKALLHTCAVLAKRFVPDIKEYYHRKTEVEGKNKMLVLNAIRFKLILRIFACVNEDRLYESNRKT